MSGHTPGPWVAGALLPDWVGDTQGRHVASVVSGLTSSTRKDRTGGDIPPEEAKANARLIAGAPDMREALQRIVDGDESCQCDHATKGCCDLVDFYCPKCIAARALAKAVIQ